MKPIEYAKQEVAAGRFPMMLIEAGQAGTFWVHDRDFGMLDCKPFLSREKAEKFRSDVVSKASKSAT